MSYIICFQCLPLKLMELLNSNNKITIERKKDLNVCDICRTNQSVFIINPEVKLYTNTTTSATLYVGCTCTTPNITTACPIHNYTFTTNL